MDSSRGLSRLQQDLLREFFARERCFVLSGGAALVGLALLGRGEIRDLVDLRAILQRRPDLRIALTDAERKDGGVSPATLAWLLESVRIGNGADLPAGVTAQELEAFRADLVKQLRRLALPGPGA